ncbi:MAG: cardiolipin synthase [Prolixibacteraceae bacterium]|nr:cardiolipin synthase [Prolixibacteraceae bacterium]
MFEFNSFWQVFSLVFLFTAIPVAIIIVLEKRSPFKTIAWILVLILIPVLGVVFYLFFGQEFRKRKLYSRRGLKSLSEIRNLSSKQLRDIEQTLLMLTPKAREKSNIIRLLLNNSNSLLTTGNQSKLLTNGAETFDALTRALLQAKHHIHLEYYIFSNDKIGNRIKNILIEKSREGVEIRILIDDVGSWGLPGYFVDDLKKNGIEIYSFMEVHFPRFTSKVNYRNHRKIVIIDGKTGFTGGINIADRYIEGTQKLGHWRDTHLQISGDAVACLQVIFAADWYFVIHENLLGGSYFPAFSEEPGLPIQITASGPDSDWETIGQAFFAAIANARETIYLTTPYLMPPQHLLEAIKIAALSHIDVRIIIPEISDAIIPKWSSFSYIDQLLEAGVKVYFYQNGFIHSKVLMVDGVFSSVGSANLDFRSLETNFEVNAFVYDETFTTDLEKQFMADLTHCREIKRAVWRKRPWHWKLRESLSHIVSPML